MNTALVVASPGFPKPGTNSLSLSGQGIHAVGWMLDHPDEVAELEAALTVDQLGTRIELP